MVRAAHRDTPGAPPHHGPATPDQLRESMSQPTAPETLGSLSDEIPVDPNSSRAKEIAGRSPMKIALGRLMRDKIAMVCAGVILFFLCVAIFAPLICKIFGVSTDTVFAS